MGISILSFVLKLYIEAAVLTPSATILLSDNILDKFKDNKESDFHFVNMKFDLCNINKNPLNNIKFYRNETQAITASELNIRKLVPENFEETIVAVYKK